MSVIFKKAYGTTWQIDSLKHELDIAIEDLKKLEINYKLSLAPMGTLLCDYITFNTEEDQAQFILYMEK